MIVIYHIANPSYSHFSVGALIAVAYDQVFQRHISEDAISLLRFPGGTQKPTMLSEPCAAYLASV